MSVDLVVGVTTEGARVAEAELADGDPAALVAAAEQSGAELLWVHSNVDLAPFGLEPAHGYTRLHADECPPGEPLPPLDQHDYAHLLDAAYRGLWGHKQVAPDATPPERAVVLGLAEDGAAVGLCRAFPAERLVDGPGLAAAYRSPERYGRLLSAACAALGPGPVGVETWGDPPDVIEAYLAIGFRVAERVGGWTLRLR